MDPSSDGWGRRHERVLCSEALGEGGGNQAGSDTDRPQAGRLLLGVR